jgi:hypothetical protein
VKYIKWPGANAGAGGAVRNTLLLMVATALIAWSVASAACAAAPAEADREVGNMVILTNAMQYIKQHHADAAPFIPDNLAFTAAAPGDKRRTGFSQGVYNGGGWTMTMGHAVTAELVYEISADYNNGKIVWNGFSKDGVISELSYTFTQ